MRRTLVLTVIVLLTALFFSACAAIQYAGLRKPDQPDAITVRSLQDNWKEYEVYYAGLHAGHPSAVMFDRKDDGREIATGRWFRVEDRESLDGLIESVKSQMPIAAYYPRLWRIVGPDGHLYGYMFTAWDHAVMKQVEGEALFVNDLPLPPYLMFRGGRGGNGK